MTGFALRQFERAKRLGFLVTRRPHYVLGRFATVRDAYVGPYSAISADAHVERAEIEHAILLERSSIIGIETRIEDSLIGADCVITRSNAIRSANRLLVGDGSRIEIV